MCSSKGGSCWIAPAKRTQMYSPTVAGGYSVIRAMRDSDFQSNHVSSLCETATWPVVQSLVQAHSCPVARSALCSRPMTYGWSRANEAPRLRSDRLGYPGWGRAPALVQAPGVVRSMCAPKNLAKFSAALKPTACVPGFLPVNVSIEATARSGIPHGHNVRVVVKVSRDVQCESVFCNAGRHPYTNSGDFCANRILALIRFGPGFGLLPKPLSFRQLDGHRLRSVAMCRSPIVRADGRTQQDRFARFGC